MKRLRIDIYNSDAKKLESIVAQKIDVSTIQTLIYLNRSYKHSDTIQWIDKIDHLCIIQGVVTIFYENNYFIKVSRIDD